MDVDLRAFVRASDGEVRNEVHHRTSDIAAGAAFILAHVQSAQHNVPLWTSRP